MVSTLVTGSFNISASGSDVICRNNGLLLQDNCYYHTDWNANVPAGVRQATSDDCRNGALCWLLNGDREGGNMAWYQTLGSDPYPIPDSSHSPVYRWSDGTCRNDDEDGIRPAPVTARDSGIIYNLAGQRIIHLPSQGDREEDISKLKRGVYIVNGKKIIRY